MKDVILDFLKGTGEYISGEQISKKLNISRTAVWKHINQLKEEGYNIESSSKRGYRLVKRPDILTYGEIKDELDTKYIGRRIVYLESATSTNDVAKEYFERGENEGLVVVSEIQTKGRGRMGKNWSTPGKDSIAATILLRPRISPYEASSITPVAALSVLEALIEVTGFNVGIKWPNDIVLDSRKLCGILTEMNADMDEVKYIIIGIGINVNQESFDDCIKDMAISLRQHFGKSFDRKILLAKILNRFEDNYEIFIKKGLAPFIEILKKYSIILGKKITVSTINNQFQAEAVDIEGDGSLLVKLENGEIRRILSGEVSIKGVYGNK